MLDELLAQDFEEIGSVGLVSNRAEVIHWLVNKEKDVRWSLTDFRVRRLSADLVLAIYKAVKVDHTVNTSAGSIRSSIWQQTPQGWKIVFHQGTKIASAQT